jgi:hypothetical protein
VRALSTRKYEKFVRKAAKNEHCLGVMPSIGVFVAVAGLALNGCAGGVAPEASTPASRLELKGQDRPISRLGDWSTESPPQPGVLLPAGCDRGDARLDQAAIRIAQGADATALAEQLSELGVPQVWPHAFRAAYASGQSVSYRAAEAWIATTPRRGERHCGVALSTDAKHLTTLAVVAVDTLSELRAFPTRARIGQWLPLEFHALSAAKDSQVWVRDPSGQSFTIPTHRNGAHVRALFTARTPGRHHIQVLERFPGGPVPALEFYCDVDVEPEATRGNATNLSQGSSTQEAPSALEVLYASLAAERTNSGAPPLLRDATLERLAQEHAQAMAARSELGHDVGLGSPVERAESAKLSATRVAENVAEGGSPASAQAALWDSASHRANWLNPSLNAVGIGMARDIQGRWWISQMFGEMRSPNTNLAPADPKAPNQAQAF